MLILMMEPGDAHFPHPHLPRSKAVVFTSMLSPRLSILFSLALYGSLSLSLCRRGARADGCLASTPHVWPLHLL